MFGVAFRDMKPELNTMQAEEVSSTLVLRRGRFELRMRTSNRRSLMLAALQRFHLLRMHLRALIWAKLLTLPLIEEDVTATS